MNNYNNRAGELYSRFKTLNSEKESVKKHIETELRFLSGIEDLEVRELNGELFACYCCSYIVMGEVFELISRNGNITKIDFYNSSF